MTKVVFSLSSERRELKLLFFLATNTYSILSVMQLLFPEDKTEDCILRALTFLIDQRWISRRIIATVAGNIELWGITARGQAYLDNTSGKVFRFPISLTQMSHRFGLQRLQILANRMGFKWEIEVYTSSGEARPDGYLISETGYVWAVEYERSLKKKSDYPFVLSDRIRTMKSGEYQSVVWVCETVAQTNWLSRVLCSISAVPVAGVMIPINSDRVQRRITVIHQDNWISFLKENFSYQWKEFSSLAKELPQ